MIGDGHTRARIVQRWARRALRQRRVHTQSGSDQSTLNSLVGHGQTPPDGTLSDEFRRGTLPACHRAIARLGALVLALPVMVAERATAQETVGQALCGTPIAEFINSTVPLLVALVIIVGTVFAFVMHVRAGVARDADQARFYFDWRNRAGYTAVTAPLLAFLLQMLLGFTGTAIENCINLVPFF